MLVELPEAGGAAEELLVQRPQLPRPDERPVVEADRRERAADLVRRRTSGRSRATRGRSGGSTTAPSRNGSMQTRTFGTPSTVIMQFGQWPEQQSSPRGRWYLKSGRRPASGTRRAPTPIVSPAKPVDLVPGERKRDRLARSIRSPGCAGRASRRGRRLREGHLEHLVRARVALGEEPLAAARRCCHHSRCSPATLSRKYT